MKEVRNFERYELAAGEVMRVRVVAQAEVRERRILVMAKDDDLGSLTVSNVRVGMTYLA